MKALADSRGFAVRLKGLALPKVHTLPPLTFNFPAEQLQEFKDSYDAEIERLDGDLDTCSDKDRPSLEGQRQLVNHLTQTVDTMLRLHRVAQHKPASEQLKIESKIGELYIKFVSENSERNSKACPT